jgi:hypothetical protein
MVSWDCLFNIKQIKAFDQKWIKWMQMLMESAKTAITAIKIETSVGQRPTEVRSKPTEISSSVDF